MNGKIKRLPDSELEIMLLIWDAGMPVSSAYLMDKLTDKKWAATTVLNFLARLVERGFLKVEKQGRLNIYHSMIDEKEYIEEESRTFFEKLHKSSLKSFVAALYDGKTISNKEAEELKKYIDELAKEAESKGE